jgi:hypothetical protein
MCCTFKVALSHSSGWSSRSIICTPDFQRLFLSPHQFLRDGALMCPWKSLWRCHASEVASGLPLSAPQPHPTFRTPNSGSCTRCGVRFAAYTAALMVCAPSGELSIFVVVVLVVHFQLLSCSDFEYIIFVKSLRSNHVANYDVGIH